MKNTKKLLVALAAVLALSSLASLRAQEVVSENYVSSYGSVNWSAYCSDPSTTPPTYTALCKITNLAATPIQLQDVSLFLNDPYAFNVNVIQPGFLPGGIPVGALPVGGWLVFVPQIIKSLLTYESTFFAYSYQADYLDGVIVAPSVSGAGINRLMFSGLQSQ